MTTWTPADVSWDEDSPWCQEHGHTGLLVGSVCAVCDDLVAYDERFAYLAELPESRRFAASLRTCGDPDCYQPEHLDRAELRRRIDAALDESTYRCARCKVCDRQIDAVMKVLGCG